VKGEGQSRCDIGHHERTRQERQTIVVMSGVVFNTCTYLESCKCCYNGGRWDNEDEGPARAEMGFVAVDLSE